MSKVFNMVGGGGGKNISSIIITGLESTDTITCTKDSKSYTAMWDSTAQHWEIVGLPLGTFTVTATNGTKTITETVLIDIAGVYEVEMNFKLWLYRDGDECEDVTSGWTIAGYAASNSAFILNQAFTKNENNMSSTSPTNTQRFNIIGTSEMIDMSGYHTMYADATVLNNERKVYQLDVSEISNVYASFGILHYNNGSSIAFGYISDSKTIAIGEANLGSFFYLSKTYSSSDIVTIHRVWLE